LYWYQISRTIFFTGIFLFEAYFLRGEGIHLLPLFIASGFTIALFIFFLFTIRKDKTFLILHLILDTLLLTFLILFSAGIESPFIPFYLIFIILASTFLYAKGGFSVAASSTLFLTLIFLNKLHPFIPPYLIFFEPTAFSPQQFIGYFIYILLFYFAAAISAYTAERLKLGLQELAEVRLTTDDILNSIGIGLVSVDKQGKIVYTNSALYNIVNILPQYMIGKDYRNIFSQIPFIQNAIWNILNGREVSDIETKLNDNIYSITTFKVKTKATPVSGAICLIKDITEKKQMEERLNLLDRLAALGKISAGVAHEIKNPLASIRGASELMLSGKKEIKKLANMVIDEVDRLDNLVKNILDYAKDESLDVKEIHLISAINDVIKVLKMNPLWTDEVSLHTNISEDIFIPADPDKIKEVFINIGLNALKAIKGKGTIEINAKVNSKNVKIEFIDTGGGIKTEIMDKIFSPFFSTDPNGFGFGLAISHKIVQMHGGKIGVESKEGKGTKFTILLRKKYET